MKKKIIGMFVCMLLIAIVFPAVESLKNSAINPTVPSAPMQSMEGDWIEMQKLLASDGAAWDLFGWSVSLDGNTTLIGAMGDDSAYVFTRTGTTWTQQAKLLASDGTAGRFGVSVSVDGDTALIGAEGDHGSTGSAYVFKRNQPPNPPTITGPAKVKTNVKYDYILNAIDPDEDDVYYYVDWGDGTNSSWIGPYTSGVNVTVSHTWTNKGTYTIKAKARDIHNAESNWTTLSISVPRVISINDLFLKFLQNHPHAFPIIRHLMDL